MEFRQLGGSGFKVPALCLGAGTFGGKNEFFSALGTTEVEEATKLADRSHRNHRRAQCGPVAPKFGSRGLEPHSGAPRQTRCLQRHNACLPLLAPAGFRGAKSAANSAVSEGSSLCVSSTGKAGRFASTRGKGWSLRLQRSAARRRSSISPPSFDQRESEIIGHDGNGRRDHERSKQQRLADGEERRPVEPDRRVLMRHVQPWWQCMWMA
jgi:hypothetical protein